MADQVTSAKLLEMLEVKYSAPHFIFMRELRDATGFDSGRSADAIAMGLYRSRGRLLTGFEVKVSRSDLLRELKSPEKAEAIGQFCDHWYLVLSDIKIAEGLDVPSPWGIYAPKGSRIHLFKPAEKLQPKPLERYFLASLMKSAQECVSKPLAAEIEQIQKQEYDRGFEAGKHWSGRAGRDLDELVKRVKIFEENSGVNIDRWIDDERLANIGLAVKRVLANDKGSEQFIRRLGYQIERIQDFAEEGKKLLKELTTEEHEAETIA